MRLLRIERLEERVEELERLLEEMLLGEVREILLESGEFAQAAACEDLEAPAVEGEEVPEKGSWGMFGDGIHPDWGVEEEKAPWE